MQEVAVPNMKTAGKTDLDRRAFVCLLAIAAPSVAAFGKEAAKLKVRDVVKMLVEAPESQRPNLSGQDLSGLNLSDLDFKGADLSRCNLFGADLTACNLEGANLSDATLDRATLVQTRFSNATLQNASIRRPSVFADMDLHARDLPIFRNADLARAQITARLDGADFSGANLSEVSFVVWEERNLGGPPTSGLARCNFSGARMNGINVRGLSLSRSVLRGADLSGADLRETDLSYADFEGAKLTGAKLEGARTEGATGLPA